jgi:hypothetical protein
VAPNENQYTKTTAIERAELARVINHLPRTPYDAAGTLRRVLLEYDILEAELVDLESLEKALRSAWDFHQRYCMSCGHPMAEPCDLWHDWFYEHRETIMRDD